MILEHLAVLLSNSEEAVLLADKRTGRGIPIQSRCIRAAHPEWVQVSGSWNPCWWMAGMGPAFRMGMAAQRWDALPNPPVKRSQLPRQSPEHSRFFIEQTAIRPSAADLTNWFGIPSDDPSLPRIPSAVSVEPSGAEMKKEQPSLSFLLIGKMIKGWVGKWMTGPRGRPKKCFLSN